MPKRSRLIIRLVGCGLSIAVALVAAGVMLASFGGRLAQAASPASPLSSDVVVTDTIQAAIDAANPGDSVIIPAGHYTESLTLSKTVSLRGALSSTTIIHALAGQRVLTVTGAGINNSTVISGLTFSDGNTTDFFGGGGIRVEVFAQPLLVNLIITGNLASTSGGGLSADLGSPLRIVNVSFYNNSSSDYGGAVYALDALIVEGGVIRGNGCTGLSCLGGGLSMGAVFPVSLIDVQFISNTALSNGGGAQVSGPLTVQGGLFQVNSAGGSGSGLWAGSTVALTGTRFISNTSAGEGGGAIIQGGATLRNALFQGNHCTNVDCPGGGLYVTGPALNLVDTQFISNTADGYGGGGLSSVAPTTIQGGLFQGNASMAPTVSTFTIGGGGLLAFNTLAVTDTQFVDNYAAGHGGGLLHILGSGRLVNTLFAGNTSGAGGDALAIDSLTNDPISLVVLHATIVEPSGPPGGAAIAVFTGTLSLTNSIVSNYAVGISRTTSAIATEDYNLFSGVGITATSGVASGGNSLVGNPAFRNPSGGDYHLAFGSAALNTASNAGVATDADGDPRPIGAGPDIGYDEARLVALSLSKTDGQTSTSHGAPLTYTILVNNAGPYAAAGVLVSDTLPAGLLPGTWTCLASAGSTCPASGSGAISATVTIASASFVQFTLHVTVAGNASGAIINTVSVSVPAGLVNTNTPNSSASDSTTIVGGPSKVYLPLVLR